MWTATFDDPNITWISTGPKWKSSKLTNWPILVNYISIGENDKSNYRYCTYYTYANNNGRNATIDAKRKNAEVKFRIDNKIAREIYSSTSYVVLVYLWDSCLHNPRWSEQLMISYMHIELEQKISKYIYILFVDLFKDPKNVHFILCQM